MITVARLVLHAIDEMNRGEVEFALRDAAIAVDVTAKRLFPTVSNSGRRYKRFISEYYWIIELMALNGINVQRSSFASIAIPGTTRSTFKDVAYHLVRCSLVHEGGLPENIALTNDKSVFFFHDRLGLPVEIVWALLSAVVFCRANSGEKSAGDAYLSYGSERFLISENWGREDALRPLYERHVTVRVTLSDTSF